MIVGGIPIFDGLSLWQLVSLLVVYAFAFTVKGVFGYGAVLPMILMGSLVMPPHHAIILAGLVNLVSHAVIVPDGLRHGNHRLAGRMILFIMPTLILGVLLFRHLEPAALQMSVGSLLLIILLAEGTSWRQHLFRIVEVRHSLFSGAVALIAGLLSGLVGGGAMIFLSVYLRSVEPDKLALRGTIILILAGTLAWRMLLLGWANLLTWSMALEAMFILPLTVFCTLIGRAVAGRLTNEAFFRAYRVFMIAAALMLIVRGAV